MRKKKKSIHPNHSIKMALQANQMQNPFLEKKKKKENIYWVC